MYEKILIAARGEIALRIIRACRELGVATVAIHSEADLDSLHIRLADESVCIGSTHPSESYLNIPRIISVAEITHADAIHPGYGFLSESARFAEICESCGVDWIGPKPDVMEKMGDKSTARKLMSEAGLPVIPGSEGIVKDEGESVSICSTIGYPVMIKAAAGGGGKGIRVVESEDSLKSMFGTASREAEASFGDSGIYIEKYMTSPRHVEVQVMGSGDGRVADLGDRECSIQRKHQKLIEEAPSPGVSEETRRALRQYAVRGAEAINYNSLGTVEFLVDSSENVYFLEMNTRVQVEHPVTEMVTGLDLIKEQIMVEAGEGSSVFDREVELRGHAIECRLNAEDPRRNFKPSPGKISFYHAPGGTGVRVDSHIYGGYTISPYYDSLLAKIIVWGANREEARRRMLRSLDETIIDGIKTTVPFLKKLLRSKRFSNADFDTSMIDKWME
jgi:acetyl-CoA carboxylase biotin carboxylase subunit